MESKLKIDNNKEYYDTGIRLTHEKGSIKKAFIDSCYQDADLVAEKMSTVMDNLTLDNKGILTMGMTFNIFVDRDDYIKNSNNEPSTLNDLVSVCFDKNISCKKEGIDITVVPEEGIAPDKILYKRTNYNEYLKDYDGEGILYRRTAYNEYLREGYDEKYYLDNPLTKNTVVTSFNDLVISLNSLGYDLNGVKNFSELRKRIFNGEQVRASIKEEPVEEKKFVKKGA